jgi:hypothetical protein
LDKKPSQFQWKYKVAARRWGDPICTLPKSIAVAVIPIGGQPMLRHVSICVTLVVLGTSSLKAQYLEATLQQVQMPGGGFDIVIAAPKSPARAIDLGNSPDALIVPLIGEELALGFEDGSEMLDASNQLRRPVCAFKAESSDGTVEKPISLHVVPAHEPSATIRAASLAVPQAATAMRKVEVPGANFVIVFATTNAPIVWEPHEQMDSLVVHSIGNELIMATDGDIEKMFKDVGLTQWPSCAFYVEHKVSSPPQAASVYVVPKGDAAGAPSK